jgi:hypothetical protein
MAEQSSVSSLPAHRWVIGHGGVSQRRHTRLESYPRQHGGPFRLHARAELRQFILRKHADFPVVVAGLTGQRNPHEIPHRHEANTKFSPRVCVLGLSVLAAMSMVQGTALRAANASKCCWRVMGAEPLASGFSVCNSAGVWFSAAAMGRCSTDAGHVPGTI